MAITSMLTYEAKLKNVNLPDMGFEFIPQITNCYLPFGIVLDARRFLDLIYPILLVSTYGYILQKDNYLTIIKRILLIWGTLIYLRAMTVFCTSLPDPSSICEENQVNIDSFSVLTFGKIIKNTLIIFLPTTLNSVLCGDMILSGHTTLIVICVLSWQTYRIRSKKEDKLLLIFFWALITFLLYLSVALRIHYTVDVILGSVITVSIWNSYHRLVRDIKMGVKFSTLWGIDIYIYKFVGWLEDETKNMSGNMNELNSYELLTLISSMDIENIKEFIHCSDNQTIKKLQNEMKLCKQSYFEENFKLAKAEEILKNLNEEINNLTSDVDILNKHIEDKEYEYNEINNEYNKYNEENENIRKKLINMVNNKDEFLKLLANNEYIFYI